MATNKDKELSEALKTILKKLGHIEGFEWGVACDTDCSVCDRCDAVSPATSEEEEEEKCGIEESQELAELLIDDRASTQDKVEGAQELIDIIFEPTCKLLAANKKKLGITDIILYVGGEIDGKPYCDTTMLGSEATTSEDIMDVFATACSRALDGYGKKYKK